MTLKFILGLFLTFCIAALFVYSRRVRREQVLQLVKNDIELLTLPSLHVPVIFEGIFELIRSFSLNENEVGMSLKDIHFRAVRSYNQYVDLMIKEHDELRARCQESRANYFGKRTINAQNKISISEIAVIDHHVRNSEKRLQDLLQRRRAFNLRITDIQCSQ